MSTQKQKIAELKVFANSDGEFGNSVGVILDEKNTLSDAMRCQVTISTGFSECVFLQNNSFNDVSIYNPQNEIAFSGHALVGTAYFLARVLQSKTTSMETKAGNVFFRMENDITWISSGLQNTPPWNYIELEEAGEIESLRASTHVEHTMYWSWLDKSKGAVRARTFAPDWGIPEDEANGSGAMQLAHHLKQQLEIHHGKGLIIYTRPVANNVVELGGRVSLGERYGLPQY